MLFRVFLPICCLFFGFLIHAQPVESRGPEPGAYLPEPVFQSQAVLDSLTLWEERMYLHTDRATAAPGEHLFFKAYAMTGPKKLRVSPSRVLKVDLTDASGALVSTQYYPLENGTASGALEIPKKLDPDTYTLRAYTRWMQNYGTQKYFTRQIRVSEEGIPGAPESGLKEVFQVQFYPEGGKLLSGLNNKLIVKASDALGCPVEIRGEIRDGTGSRVVDVENYRMGLGMSMLKPEAGKSYTLHLDNGSSFALPPVQENGYSLQLNTLDPERIRVRVAAVGEGGGPVFLSGRSGNETFFEEAVEMDANGELQMEIPKKELPAGMVHFILRRPGGEILTERPLRLEGRESLRLAISPVSHDLSEGGENTLRLKVTDAEGNPLQTEVSLAVASGSGASVPGIADYVHPNPGAGNIQQYRRAMFLEDLNALAFGTGQSRPYYPQEIRYPIQRELELIGYAYDLNNELLRNTDVQVMSSTDENLFIQEVRTDGSGILKVSGMDFTGEIPLIFRTAGEDTRSSLVRFEPLHDEIYERAQSSVASPVRPFERKRQRAKDPVETTPWTQIDTTGLIALAEATVTAKKQEEKETPSVYGIEPRRVMRQDPKKPYNNWGELLQRMPGVFVSGNIFVNPIVKIPGQNAGPVRWVVDGLLLVANQNPFDLVSIIDVERIELLSVADASIYGSRGSGAILAVYTRNGSGADYVRRKDAMVTFKGFASGLPFEQYLEQRDQNRKLRKKAPATLYWNPAVETDENGEALIRFKSPADYESVRITAETLTQDGRPGAAALRLVASQAAHAEQ